eukprot:scaffold3737_cov72-Cyclotella_meneghiniana.AAC.3
MAMHPLVMAHGSDKTLEMAQIVEVSGREEGINVWQFVSGVWVVHWPPLSRSSLCSDGCRGEKVGK